MRTTLPMAIATVITAATRAPSWSRHFTPACTSGGVDACFIAIAADGSMMAGAVSTLRRFRDATLERTVLGERVVESYYTVGSPVAQVVGESELLRATARAALAPIGERAKSAMR